MNRFTAIVALWLVCCGARTNLLDDDIASPDADAPEVATSENACGGTASLQGYPQGACGDCGLWQCDGEDAVVCEDPGLNMCGECGPLPQEECNGRDDDCDEMIDEGCVLRLAWYATQDVRIRVSRDNVVFDAQGLNNNEDVVLVTISSGTSRVLTPSTDPLHGPGDPSKERQGAIGGNLVAWVQWTGLAPPDIGTVQYMDLERNQIYDLPESAPAGFVPAVDGTRIVYQGAGWPRDWDIWMWETETETLSNITGAGAHEMKPDLSGHWLVFERAPLDDEHFGRHVYAHNLENGEELLLSEELEGWHVAPSIDGYDVVWHREQGNSSPSREADVFHFNLETGERMLLSQDGMAFNPRVSEQLVCWSTTNSLGPSGGQWQPGGVTVHDLATRRQRELVADAHLCDVDGSLRRVVWLERRGGLDPYLRDLLPSEP